MTSPSFPVSVNRSLPGMMLTSTGKVSPPTLVHANPVAIPTLSVKLEAESLNLGVRKYCSMSCSEILCPLSE